MFGLEALDLARIQFAFTISFHILFPAITIGLASYLAVLEGLWLKTHNDTYRDLYHFWSKIFAVNFGMGLHQRSPGGVRIATVVKVAERPAAAVGAALRNPEKTATGVRAGQG